MKSLLSIFILMTGLCFGNNVLGQGVKPKLEISHLTGDLYVYTTYKPFEGSPFPSNSMYMVTAKGIVMFDTPWDSTQFQPLLDSIESRHHQPVVLCIATHYHADRTAGLEFLRTKGVRTYTTKQTYDLCREHNEKQAQYYFVHDTTFTVGDHSFQTYYPGAGHTKDNIVVWLSDEQVLYGGCFVKSTESKGLGNVADADIQAWTPSVKKVMKQFPNPKYVIPGHLRWDDKGGLKHTLKLLKG